MIESGGAAWARSTRGFTSAFAARWRSKPSSRTRTPADWRNIAFDSNVRELDGALSTLAQDNAPEAEDRCRQFTARARAGTTDVVVSKGKAAEKAGDLGRAIILFRIATRLEPDAPAPYQALCNLLPKLNLQGEARANCQTARTLESKRRRDEESSSRLTEWILTGSAVAFLAAGGVSYADALRFEDLAWEAEAVINAVEKGDPDISQSQLEKAIADRAENNDKARSSQFLSWGLSGVGAALGIAAVVGWLGAGDDSIVGIGPNQVTLQFAW